jgi:hypothetical protein
VRPTSGGSGDTGSIGVLTTVDAGEDRLGSMIVGDPETLDEQRIDDRVLSGWNTIDDDGHVVYAVTDGDRSGVWRIEPTR